MTSNYLDIDLSLPYITEDLAGIGGKIRQTLEHFVVEEVPLYEPSGTGKHLYLNITKENITTRDVQLQLAKLFELKPEDIGKAGLKDKYARTTQSFSVIFESQPDPDEVVELVESFIPVKVNWAKYHDNKLRSGHLEGNRFTLVISEPEHPESYEQARMIADRIHEIGLPNYYGIQRTGEEGENIVQGWMILKKQKRLKNRWLRRYLISSYQSYLCNLYIAERVRRNQFTKIMRGDIAKKHDTGGLFWVDDVSVEQQRFDDKEISFTAPMYGYKMSQPKYEALELEDYILDNATVSLDEFRDQHIKGTRRMGRLVPGIDVADVEDGVQLSFMLPKGGFATTLLREFMKNDVYAD